MFLPHSISTLLDKRHWIQFNIYKIILVSVLWALLLGHTERRNKWHIWHRVWERLTVSRLFYTCECLPECTHVHCVPVWPCSPWHLEKLIPCLFLASGSFPGNPWSEWLEIARLNHPSSYCVPRMCVSLPASFLQRPSYSVSQPILMTLF